MRLFALCLVAGLVVTGAVTAAVKPRPYQWTTAQASAALMRQAEDFYYEVGVESHDITTARCRGTGKAVQRRFVSFICIAAAPRGISDPVLNLRVPAKTRRAGGLCWAVAPAPIPSGCLAAGRRGVGSSDDAFRAVVTKVGPMNFNSRCWPNGAGFYSCTWETTGVVHRATVVFAPAPVVKVLS